ncbi:MAG: peptidase dimerization domain-containing protein, partial [Pseudomonadota bacterium]
IERLARAIRRIGNNPMRSQINGPTRELFDRLSRVARWPFNWIYGLHRVFESLMCEVLKRSPEIDAALRSTAVVTQIEGGVADNVAPQSARCVIDCRIKPGETVADLADHIRNVVNDSSIRIEIMKSHPASPVSSTKDQAYLAIEQTLGEVFPDAITVPFTSLNDTDSKHFQELADAQFRFVPITLSKSDLARIHGTDERIAIGDYVRLVEFYMAFIRRLDLEAA